MRTTTIAAGLVALLLPTLAACADTGSEDAEAADSDTIVIGTLGAPSAMMDVMEASVEALNDAGGIGGKQVKLVSKETTMEGTDGPAAVKELIDKDGVVAIVGQTSNTDAQWQQYAAQKGVPVIGGLNVNTPYVTNPLFFPTGSNIYAMGYGIGEVGSRYGKKVGNLYCAESPQCASSKEFAPVLDGLLGTTTDPQVEISSTASDFTAACQALIDAKVDTYKVAADGPVVAKVATACADQGLKARLVTADATVRSLFAGIPQLDGTVAVGSTVPFVDDSTPGTKAYQEMLAEYLPEIGGENGPLPMNSFIAVELFKKAVELGGTEEVTSESIIDGLYKMKDETLGGLTVPLTFTEGRPTIVNCYFTLGIEDGEFTMPEGLDYTCAPDDLIEVILKSANLA
ncbi:MAG TPA: ABC transporter substrate-binding protein [Nocardioides sp.]|nr:ABC transporter substrate-binding protein [Nocardioides sp.]